MLHYIRNYLLPKRNSQVARNNCLFFYKSFINQKNNILKI